MPIKQYITKELLANNSLILLIKTSLNLQGFLKSDVIKTE